MKVYDWNIDHRIRDTKYLFEAGVVGLILGIITFPLPNIVGKTILITAIMHGLSSILIGIGIGVMLFSTHHIKYLYDLKRAEASGSSVYWAKI